MAERLRDGEDVPCGVHDSEGPEGGLYKTKSREAESSSCNCETTNFVMLSAVAAPQDIGCRARLSTVAINTFDSIYSAKDDFVTLFSYTLPASKA